MENTDIGLTQGHSSADDVNESAQAPMAAAYVTFFEHSSYGGVSYTGSQPLPSLVTIGWNDAISSFKSLNGQRPRWWEHTDYTGLAWQSSAGAWVRYVTDGANDRFSSVKNVP